MEEIWKDIPEYEGLYQVSDLGRVRSLNYNQTGEIKLLKQSTNKKGYKQISLYKNGKEKKYRVHRLVAIAFLPNPNNYKEVNHKDECKSNNNMNNLEWCTREYNINYGTVRKRISESKKGEKNPFYGKKGKYHPTSKPILMYDKEGNFIRRFESMSATNEYFGKKNAYKNVSDCLTGKQKTAYGYIFRYAEEIEKK